MVGLRRVASVSCSQMVLAGRGQATFFGRSSILFPQLNFFFTDYDDVLECEYYLPRTDQWVKVAPMLTGQSDVGIAVYNDRIYVTGGYR